MTNTTRRSASPLINDLLSHGHQYSFSQVMRIARMQFGPGGEEELPGVPWQERVRVQPDLSLAFPAADVVRVERIGVDGAELLVTTTFLGLYGASSPMPTHYTEDLIEEALADSSVSRDFLNIFHQRLYHLYFQSWSKYQHLIRIEEEKNPQDLERLFCLIGLGERELRDSVPEAKSLLRYTGLFSQPRSALGLQTFLRDALAVRKLEVEQWVPRRVPIPEDQRMRLGVANNCLGVNAILGSEMPDLMGKFRIHIGPLSKSEFDSFLPGTPNYKKLARFIRLYLVDPLDFDLRLILTAGEAEPIRLGDPNGARLGWNSWCFSGATLGEVSTIFPLAQCEVTPPAPVVDDCSDPDIVQPSTLIEYYQQELAQLRDFAADYASHHPALASMVNGHQPDPGVERLFEGFSLQCANLRQKLDDDMPEFIHDVVHAIEPNYLRPIPATTIIVFLPKATCSAPQIIPAGTELASVPLDGTACRFTTRYPVEIHPLLIVNAFLADLPGKPDTITLSLKLDGIPLSDWTLKNLRLFLTGKHVNAANLYLVLMRYLKKILIAPVKGGQPVTLDATHVQAAGFDDTEVLFPSASVELTCHQMMQEYFVQPDKFLFLDLLGWEKWCGRGEGSEFEIRFELDRLPCDLHQISKEDFALFATPAVNVFEHPAEPIALDNQQWEHQIIPADGQFGRYDIYSVQHVTGLLNHTSQKVSLVSDQQVNLQFPPPLTYHLEWRKAALGNDLNIFLSVDAPQDSAPTRITTLLVDLACTNADIPERLKIGDICKETDTSPSFAAFTNCKPTTRYRCIREGTNALWNLHSHHNLNLFLLNARTLRAMLERVLRSCSHDYTTTLLHSKWISGITGIQVSGIDRVIDDCMQRGWEITIKLDSDRYESIGELYMFGALLDHFLRFFATESCFTRTIIEDASRTERYEWPTKMGRRPML